ncbi:unnamed protein product [Tuber melanosporum]|uniref:(Perigord truffle) hypothetical protein n=1 Tax=Tuber melanosporum (strain Mel28) TaxID=656061 RepID=D5GCC3_TUBMM|nr:uncharacterized protein GSTUM_00005813001 [Tuber melanosporum]CAZ82166.1 unnamed protein product [Tuber melanosporum]
MRRGYGDWCALLEKTSPCSIVDAVVIGALHFLFLSGGYFGTRGGICLQCRRVILLGDTVTLPRLLLRPSLTINANRILKLNPH